MVVAATTPLCLQPPSRCHVMEDKLMKMCNTKLRFAQSAAPAFLFFALLSFAAAVVVAIFLSSSQTQRNISINGAMLESSSSFSSHVLHFFVSSSLLFLLFLTHVVKSPSTFMSLSLPSCTGALPCTDASVLCTLAPLTCCGCSAAMYSATRLFGRHPCSQLVCL